MSTFHRFIDAATRKAAEELVTAIGRVPEDKQDWTPGGTARTAMDMFAECVIMNRYTVDMIRKQAWPEGLDKNYGDEKAKVYAMSPEERRSALHASVEAVCAAVATVPDADLAIVVAMPWDSYTMEEICSYPYWNMSYHVGQTNYIAAILGCLD